MATPPPPVPNGQERQPIAPDEEDDDEDDDPVLFSFQHVRTASVILPSGDRVRKRVSLMSVYDESPFDESETAALIQSHGTGGTAGTAYSSIAPSLVDRGPQPWDQHSTRWEKCKKWLHSEALKRHTLLFLCEGVCAYEVGCSNVPWHIGLGRWRRWECCSPS